MTKIFFFQIGSWPLEAANKYCATSFDVFNDGGLDWSYRLNISQIECQNFCLGRPTCVGIAIKYGNWRSCALCENDDMRTSTGSFYFYRRPGMV